MTPPMNGPTTPIVEVAKRLSVPMREALLHRDRYADPNTIRALRKRGLIGNAARTLFGHQVADHLLASQVPGPISNERGDEK